MGRGTAIVIGALTLPGVAFPAAASETVPRLADIDIAKMPLADALNKLARDSGSDLLFDEATVAGLVAAPVRGQLTIATALTRLLAGTGIAFRLTAENVYMLNAGSRPSASASDGAIAEILVIGRRTQNADIRRTENDIQPYDVITMRDIAFAHQDNVDDLLRVRLTQNTQNIAVTQDPATNSGSPRSEVNLRGLGSRQTLVLIDGRRLPGVPTNSNVIRQPDVNALPMGAIERIETLASTAGGIYGPGAIGGVVNFVLRRDYRGAELNVTGGISDRGDAQRLRLEGRIGFTPDGGRTDVMLFASHTESGALRTGDRDYLAASRMLAFDNNPGPYLARYLPGNAINVVSAAGLDSQGNLTLDSALGGAVLGSPITYLPLNFAGPPADRAAALVSNAGKIVTALAPDNSGSRGNILTRPSTSAGIANIRHRWGDGVETFVDALYLRNRGVTPLPVSSGAVRIAADAPTNPFAQDIILTYPLPVAPAAAASFTDTVRITAGAIVQLPSRWRASVDFTWSIVRTGLAVDNISPSFAFNSLLASGAPGPDGLPALDPLGNWPRFFASVPAYFESRTIRLAQSNRSTDATLRLGGPVFDLSGGPLTLTLLGETRTERVAASETVFAFDNVQLSNANPYVNQRVNSGYAELRAPLVADDATTPLRGLELQLALRYDGMATTIPANFASNTQSSYAPVTAWRNTRLYTAGLRFFPLSAVMLRSSIAIGDLPPGIDQISSRTFGFDYDAFGLADNKRGDRPIGSEGAFDYISGGSVGLPSERARSVSAGLVINPAGRRPRLSVDYTYIRKTAEISFVYAFNAPYFVANEALYPDRIKRQPLTAADAALGFTGGRITSIDSTALNSGNTFIEAVDLQFDWKLRTGASSVNFFAKATWQPTLKHRPAPDLPEVVSVGAFDGPLEWRGYAGAVWQRERLTLGVTAQYYDSYRAASSNPNQRNNKTVVGFQGSATIPSQVYFDLASSLTIGPPATGANGKPVELRLGIQNIFDHRPPTVANLATSGYSYYGDPRRRRFEMTVATGF